MKLIKRAIILIIAAVLGAVTYNRYDVVKNILPERALKPPKEEQRPFVPPFHGGIGPVGNPHSQETVRKPSYTTTAPQP